MANLRSSLVIGLVVQLAWVPEWPSCAASTSVTSTLTIFTAVAIPGTVAALVVAGLAYEVELSVSWSIIPATLLTSAMATSVGQALANVIPASRVIDLITNLVIFLVLLFAPIVVALEGFRNGGRVRHVLPMSVVIERGSPRVWSTSVASSMVRLAWVVGSWLLVA